GHQAVPREYTAGALLHRDSIFGRGYPVRRSQNMIFRASCTIRGSPSVESRFPKLEFVMPVLGWLKFVLFITLNASKRNWPNPTSPRNGSRKPLTMDAAILAKPGPSRTFRPKVPKVLGAGLRTRVVSKYSATFSPLLRPLGSTGFPSPIKSTRAPEMPASGSPVAFMEKKRPDCSVKMPENFQSPVTAFARA